MGCRYTIAGKTYEESEFKKYLLALPPSEATKYIPSVRAMPSMPMEKTWHELAFKRALRYAVENGYDQVAWTTGEQQAERYDLSKRVNSIAYTKNPNGSYFLKAYTEGHLTGTSLGEAIAERELPDVVGKDVADKIISGHGTPSRLEGWKNLSGVDLKVGGEGMRGFYDRILPAFANKYAKKWGAKVGETEIPVGSESVYGGEQDAGVLRTVGLSTETRAKTEAVHTIPITDVMRESVMQGQPMFKRGEAPEGWAVAETEPDEQVLRENVRGQNLVGTPIKNLTPEGQKLLDEVEALVRHLAPKANLKVMAALRAGKFPVNGAVYRDGDLVRSIVVSLASPDPSGTATHEVIHWLKAMNYITPEEWATLEDAAEKEGWLKKHAIPARYPSKTHSRATQLEEAIAEEAEWRRDNEPGKKNAKVDGIFARIAAFFQKLRDLLRRMFGAKATADEIFAKVFSGEMGARETGAPVAEEAQFQRPRQPQGASAGAFGRLSSEPPPVTIKDGVKVADQAVEDGARTLNEGGGAGAKAEEMASGFMPKAGPRPEKHLDGVAGALQRKWIFPRTLAATDWRSGKYWSAVQKKDDEANRLLHEGAEGSVKYIALKPDQKAKLHGVEEIARLKGVVLPDDGFPVVMRNDLGVTRANLLRMPPSRLKTALVSSGIEPADTDAIIDRIEKGDSVTIRRALDQLNPPTVHSKFGDVIQLDDATRGAYFERRELFAQRWRDIMKGAAVKLGWDGDLDTTKIREAAELNESPAAKRRLENIAAVLDAMAEQERQGYVPFMRFGDYYAAVWTKLDPDTAKEDIKSLSGFPRTLEFRLVETKAPWRERLRTSRREGEVPKAAEDAIADLRKRWPEDHYEIRHGYTARNPELLRQLDIPAVEKLLTALGQDDTEVYGPIVEKLLAQMYEEIKAGFKKRANNVAGYSPNFERATGSYLHWTSHHVANAMHGREIDDVKQQYIDRHPSKGTREYWDKYDFDMKSTRNMLRGLQQFAFNWALAGNMSSTIMNFLEGPTVANFTLGIGLGPSKTGTAVVAKRLYPAMGQAIKAMRFNSKTGADIDLADVKGLTDDERAGLERADKIGLLRSTATDDLMGMWQNSPVPTGMSASDWTRIQKIAGSNISAVDRSTRIAVWLTAHRLARLDGAVKGWAKVWGDNQIWREMVVGAGSTPEAAARFMVDESTFVWGSKNLPEMQRGTIGRAALTFQGYKLRYLSTIWRNQSRMGWEGRRANMMMMLAMFALAGGLGFPFAIDAEKSIDWLWKFITGIDPMFRANAEKFMEDSGWSRMGAEMALYGAPRAVLGADLSSRLGYGAILGDFDTTNNPFAMLGAIPGIAYNAATQGTSRLKADQPFGAAAQFMPAAIRNPFLGLAVYPKEGVRTRYQDESDKPVVAPKDITVGEQVVRALGFQPSNVAKAYEDRLFYQRLGQALRDEAAIRNRQRPRRSLTPEQRVPRRGRSVRAPFDKQ